ncbi:MAG TPA: DUF1318 domain-containing protein [Candidatus Omnitrophota bacterium]|jgi:uncharacterized protein YdbL (DUF1318 family)|nr:DUF1318 domain-containing protein [Candidatus Omnitrophota bacterium]HPW77408.1 DUF1318 domain-containing protein [Candidatus Omnitrophota bacterium]
MRRSLFMSAIIALSVIAMVVPSVFAGSYDLKEITPAVKQALENRQARYSQLQSLKQKGAVGEDNKGFVADLGRDPQAAAMVSSENRDRRIIYQALVDQNKLGSAGMTEVQKVFAEVQRDKASSGEYIQTPAGEWSRKT